MKNLIDKAKKFFNPDEKAIQRLSNINTREVSLVDNPAIDEPFFEVKNRFGLKYPSKEGTQMDKEQIKAFFQEALKPVTEMVEKLTKRLDEAEGKLEKSAGATIPEETTKSINDIKEGFETLKKQNEELVKKLDEAVKDMNTLADDTEAGFNFFKEKLGVKGSQKIKGQEKEGEEPKESKWPSFGRLSH